MHKITVEKLFKTIIENQFKSLDLKIGGYEEIRYNHMLEDCDILNLNNRTLQRRVQSPYIHEIVGERLIDLIGDEIVSGDYLVYKNGTHDSCERVCEYTDLKKIEAYILGGAGLSNIFTGEIIVIKNGEFLPYEVWGLDKENVERKFVQKSFSDVNIYKNSRIIWGE